VYPVTKKINISIKDNFLFNKPSKVAANKPEKSTQIVANSESAYRPLPIANEIPHPKRNNHIPENTANA
jgi:hypothetical protein